MFKIVQVQSLGDFRLRLRFADGIMGDVDLAPLAGQGVFSLWMVPGEFAKVTIGTGGELRWNDQVDLCADALYLQITERRAEDVFPNLTKVSADARD